MSSRKLFVINSPSYVENHSSHTINQTLIKENLDEHFTYLYYNLLKFDLVDEIIIFPRVGPHDEFKNEIDSKIELENDKAIILNWNRESAVDIINQNPGSYVYCWSNYKDCEKIKNCKVIINPVTLGTSSKKLLNKEYHHYALIEGMSHQKYFNVVPNDIKIGVSPTTSKKFTELNVEDLQAKEKVYDWVMVTSCDPRKRHLEFLKSISKNQQFETLKGCLALKNPDNKRHRHEGHDVLNSLKSLYENKNVDIFLNVDNDLKIDLLSKSKIFVCCSVFDCGPRAMIEAIQAGLPILSQPHIGASDWVYEGVNGEFFTSFDNVEDVFYRMLSKYNTDNEYLRGAKQVSENIKPNHVYPKIVKEIREFFMKNRQISM